MAYNSGKKTPGQDGMPTVDKVAAMFRHYDVNKDGGMNLREFKRVLVHCGMDEGKANDLFKSVDKNNDNCISVDEFINWIFAKADTRDDSELKTATVERMAPGVKKKWEAEMEDIKKWKAAGSKGEKPTLSKITFIPHEVIIEKKVMPTPQEVIDLMGEALVGGAWDPAQSEGKAVADKYVPEKERMAALEDFFENLCQVKADSLWDKKGKRLVRKDKASSQTRDLTVADIFNSFDLNHNGKVTISEFIQGCQLLGAKQDEVMLRQLFLIVDKQEKAVAHIAVHGCTTSASTADDPNAKHVDLKERRDGSVDWQEFRNALYSSDAGKSLAPKTWSPP